MTLSAPRTAAESADARSPGTDEARMSDRRHQSRPARVQARSSEFVGVDRPKQLWDRCFEQTCIIKRNEDAARGLMHKLDRAEYLRGKPLAAPACAMSSSVTSDDKQQKDCSASQRSGEGRRERQCVILFVGEENFV